MPNRTQQTPTWFDEENDQLMFIFLAKLGRDIAQAAGHRPLLQMNKLAYSQVPIDPKERSRHNYDIRQLEDINRILNTGISTCESMLERFRLLREANVKRVKYTAAYLSILRRLPSDNLYLIFDCCVNEAGVSPWTLAAVSQQFRGIALTCPKAGSYITNTR